MAVRWGMGLSKRLILGTLSKRLILVAAGCTGSLILKNAKLSDILNGKLSDILEDLQVRRLATVVRQVASSRQITVVIGDPDPIGDMLSLLVPAAALWALGYGYMRWKATKRHLTQRIENLDGKFDEQKELTKSMKNEVSEVRAGISQVGVDLEVLQNMVCGLNGKIGALEDKQDFANAGVWYLCQFVGGAKDGKMAEFFQGRPKTSKRLQGFTDGVSAKGLQYIADTIKSGTDEK